VRGGSWRTGPTPTNGLICHFDIGGEKPFLEIRVEPGVKLLMLPSRRLGLHPGAAGHIVLPACLFAAATKRMEGRVISQNRCWRHRFTRRRRSVRNRTADSRYQVFASLERSKTGGAMESRISRRLDSRIRASVLAARAPQRCRVERAIVSRARASIREGIRKRASRCLKMLRNTRRCYKASSESAAIARRRLARSGGRRGRSRVRKTSRSLEFAIS